MQPINSLPKYEQVLLSHFAILPADFISYRAMKTFLFYDTRKEEKEYSKALKHLVDTKCLKHDPKTNGYKIPLEIRKAILRLRPPTVKNHEDLIGYHFENVIEYEKHNPLRGIELIPNVLSILKYVKENHLLIANLANNLAQTFLYTDAETALHYHKKALQIKQTLLEPNDLHIATAYNNIAATYSNLGDYKKVLEYHHLSLAIKEEHFSPNDPDMAITYNNLGLNYHKAGDYKKALKIQLENLEADDYSIGIIYNNMASNFCNLNDCEQARHYSQLALKILKSHYEYDHPDLAKAVNVFNYIQQHCK